DARAEAEDAGGRLLPRRRVGPDAGGGAAAARGGDQVGHAALPGHEPPAGAPRRWGGAQRGGGRARGLRGPVRAGSAAGPWGGVRGPVGRGGERSALSLAAAGALLCGPWDPPLAFLCSARKKRHNQAEEGAPGRAEAMDKQRTTPGAVRRGPTGGPQKKS